MLKVRRDPHSKAQLDIRPLTGVLGAEIHGVDLGRELDAPSRAAILQAFHNYGVIYFPDQKPLTNAQHLEFSGIFGSSFIHIPQLPSIAENKFVQEVRRAADEQGTYVIGENWHTDSTWMEKPPLCIVMRAVDVPEVGGDTCFSSMYLAYETLSPKLQEVLSRLKGVHSATFLFGSAYQKREKRYQHNFVDTALGDGERVHPVVCTHPATGRKFLFVNRVFVRRFEGMTEAESRPLLEFLFDHASRAEFGCRVRWRPNQVLVWDNRCTHHKAVGDYPGRARLMLRVTVEGAPPRA